MDSDGDRREAGAPLDGHVQEVADERSSAAHGSGASGALPGADRGAVEGRAEVKILTIIVVVAALVAALSFLSGWLLWLLWNWIVPEVFHGPTVTYWQAFGIMLLLSFVKGAVTVNNKCRS